MRRMTWRAASGSACLVAARQLRYQQALDVRFVGRSVDPVPRCHPNAYGRTRLGLNSFFKFHGTLQLGSLWGSIEGRLSMRLSRKERGFESF